MGDGADSLAVPDVVNADELQPREPASESRRPGTSEGMSSSERRLLAAMPLHAITTLHGEAGLQERLAIQIQSFSATNRDRITRALELVTRLHSHDRRQREPYLNHLLRVAIRIISHYGVRDTDIVCAALLHDAVEDHAEDLVPDGSQQDALAVLARQFGTRVADLVTSVTNPPAEPGRDRHEQYREHVVTSLEASPWARVIKASDFTDNGVGLIHTTGAKLESLAAKYAPLVPVLSELVARPDTPLSAEAKERIVDQLARAAQRFAAIRPDDQRSGGTADDDDRVASSSAAAAGAAVAE